MISAPTAQDVFLVLQPFIADSLGISPSLVIQGLPNRTAMPLPQPGFVVMQAVGKRRLRTNVDTWDTSDPDPSTVQLEQAIRLRVQIDCYGSSSSNWSDILSTILRDEVGCVALAPTCQPLFCSDPFIAPLVDSEDQYEERWTFEAMIQYNPVVSTPMQFADTLTANLINVDERYPPT